MALDDDDETPEPVTDPWGWDEVRGLIRTRLSAGDEAGPVWTDGLARVADTTPRLLLRVTPEPGCVAAAGYFPGRLVLGVRARTVRELETWSGRAWALLSGWRPVGARWRLKGFALDGCVDADAGLAADRAGSLKRRDMTFTFLALRDADEDPEEV